MQVIPFVRNFEVAASVHCSPKIISLETLPTQFVMHSTVFIFFLVSQSSFASGEQDIIWQRI